MNDRIQRITEMEQRLNRLLAWERGDKTTTKEIIQEDICLLDEYYRSPLWHEDYEADEAGELPKDLPRGVLSEDGIYNALEDYSVKTSFTSAAGPPAKEAYSKQASERRRL